MILPRTAQDWTDERIRVVLAHELAHIKRGDWLIQMVAEIARAGYWFNPVMWIACRRLRQESEQATDDVVLDAGIEGSDYAAHLLELARAFSRHRPWLPAPAIARPSSLERRVSAMLNTRVNRTPITRAARLAIIGALSAVAIAVASAQGAFSTFSGTVFDPLNGYLPGVTMTLTNTQSGAKHEIRSDRTGHFEFVGLPPGAYTLQAILPGFSVLSGTLDLTGRDLQRDVTLKIGQLEETISIWASKAGDNASAAAPAAKRRPAPDKFAAMKSCSEGMASAGAMGGNLRQPTKLVDVKPRYPAQLAESGTGGVLVFDGAHRYRRHDQRASDGVVREPGPRAGGRQCDPAMGVHPDTAELRGHRSTDEDHGHVPHAVARSTCGSPLSHWDGRSPTPGRTCATRCDRCGGRRRSPRRRC